MLEIRIRQPKDGVCPICGGSGVVIPKDGEKRLVEVGAFCSECDEGRLRWQEVVKTVSVVERYIGYKGHGVGDGGAQR